VLKTQFLLVFSGSLTPPALKTISISKNLKTSLTISLMLWAVYLVCAADKGSGRDRDRAWGGNLTGQKGKKSPEPTAVYNQSAG
jgi:hypothetical protein